MKLDAWTREVFRNFASHNPSLLVKEGSNQSTIAKDSKRVFASAVLKQSFPQEFGIADLASFDRAISLFKEPDITFGERSLTVTEGSRTLEYGYAAKEVIVLPPQKKINIGQLDVEFRVPWATFTEVLKAAGVLGKPEIAFLGKKGKLLLSTYDADKQSDTGFSTQLGEVEQTFAIIFRTEDVKLLPRDYNVGLSFRRIARFWDDEVEYFIGANDTSTVPNG